MVVRVWRWEGRWHCRGSCTQAQVIKVYLSPYYWDVVVSFAFRALVGRARLLVEPLSELNVGAHRAGSPLWLFAVSPLDPYKNQEAARSKAVPPISRISAAPSKVVGGGQAEMNTGGELPGTTLYHPSFGEPKRENRRKGYFRNPDLDEPRPGAYSTHHL